MFSWLSPEKVYAWISALGGRRFLMTLGAGAVHTVLLVMGYMNEQTYMTLTLSTVAVYIGASTYQKTQEMRSA